jgi:ATPase family associated with various cellular activities (AAA)
MIFLGPPGSGKTTAARRFGEIFYNLELLPTSNVVETTGKTMQGQYVGQTAKIVTELMDRAKGGVLFIDEAYGLYPERGSYGSDAVQTLLDNITKPEYKGKLLVILAGYEEQVEKLFDINPGLRSRFDKRRVYFQAWTPQQAVLAAKNMITRDGKAITPAAETAMASYVSEMSTFPDFANARDVFETILPEMYQRRANRVAGLGAGGAGAPYEAEDVHAACSAIVGTRRAAANYVVLQGDGAFSGIRRMTGKRVYFFTDQGERSPTPLPHTHRHR